MVEIFDYSMRRGVIVKMLPQIHALMTDNAGKDKLSGIAPPQHIILWKQKMRAELTDIRRRWLFALDGADIAGFMFYRFGEGDSSLYISELQIAYAYRHNEMLFNMLMDKFISDKAVSACEKIFAGERVKVEEDKEILASVGFKENLPDGWQPLGAPREAAAALKLRYER